MHDNIDLEKIPDSGHGILSEFEPSLFHVDLQKLELVHQNFLTRLSKFKASSGKSSKLIMIRGHTVTIDFSVFVCSRQFNQTASIYVGPIHATLIYCN